MTMRCAHPLVLRLEEERYYGFTNDCVEGDEDESRCGIQGAQFGWEVEYGNCKSMWTKVESEFGRSPL